MENQVNIAEVCSIHNECLRHLLDTVVVSTSKNLEYEVVKFFEKKFPNESTEILNDLLKYALYGKLIQKPLDEIGLSDRLHSAISIYRSHVQNQTLSDKSAHELLMKSVAGFSNAEAALAELYSGIFEASVGFWEKEIPSVVKEIPSAEEGISSRRGTVSSSHYYTDWGCLGTADAAGAVAAAGMVGIGVMFFAASPPTGVAAGIYLGIAAAMASFTASQTGNCNREIDRDNIPTPGEKETPGGGGRGPVS